MQSQHKRRSPSLPGLPIALGAAAGVLVLLHASGLGPFSDNVLRLAVIAMSLAAGIECAVANPRLDLTLAVLTVLLYWLYLYPLEMVPPRPGFFRAFYLSIAACALSLVPVMLLRLHVALAAVLFAAGIVSLPYLLP